MQSDLTEKQKEIGAGLLSEWKLSNKVPKLVSREPTESTWYGAFEPENATAQYMTFEDPKK